MRNSWKMQECDRACACSVQIFNFSFLIFFKAKDCRSQTTCFACLFNQIPEPFQFIFPCKLKPFCLTFTVVVKEECHCISVPENDVNIQFYDSYKKFGLLASKMFLAHQNQKGRIQYKSKVWDRSVG